MTRATAARRPAVDLSARPNSPVKGPQFKKRYVTALGNLHELDISADEFALVDLDAPSLGPAPDPCNRHALTGACNPVHAADGGSRVTRSRLVRFGRRAPSTSANDAAGDQPTGGYSAVLSLRPRIWASGLEMSGLEMPLRTANAAGEPSPRTIVEEQVLRHDTEIEP